MAEQDKGKDKGKTSLTQDLKSYFNGWAKDWRKMGREEGLKIGTGAAAAGGAAWIVGGALSLVTFGLISISVPFAAVAGAVIATKPLRGRTARATLSLMNEFEPTRKLLLPPPEEKSKKGPSGKGPGGKP